MDIVPALRTSPGFVGRDDQLVALREAFDLAVGGEPVAVLIGGEAGIGKTRLVEEFLAEAAGAGARVVVGQSVELGDRGPAFAPVVGVIRGLLAEFGAERLIELAGPAGEALTSLLPELGTGVGDTLEGRGRLYDVVTTLLERVAAERPLVVVVEDLQWADAPTRDLLRFMVRAVGEVGLLAVATYRTDELHRGHPLRPFLAEMDRVRRVRRVEVPRLDSDDVRAMVCSVLGREVPADSVARIHRRSEGIPFFVEELAYVDGECGCDDLPGSLRDLLLVRVEPLSAPTQGLLRLIAAGGNHVDHAVVAEVAELEVAELETALREAVSSGVVSIDGEGYAFRHALLREALHDDMLPGEHARMHARYAQVLERRPELLPTGVAPVEIAHHWHSAHDVERAFSWSLRAADELVRTYAHATAQQMLERALDLWDQVEDPEASSHGDRLGLVLRASDAARDAGDVDRALALIKGALKAVDDDGTAERMGELLARKGALLDKSGRPGGIETLEQALALIPAEPPSPLRAEVLVSLSISLMLSWRLDESIAIAGEAIEVADQCGAMHIASSAINTRGTAWVQLGDVERGLAELRRAREAADGRAGALLRYHINLSDSLNLIGRYAEAVEVATEGKNHASALGRKRTHGSMLAGNAAEPMLMAGDWNHAERLIRRGLELGPPATHARHLLALRTSLLTWRGELEAADAAMIELREALGGRLWLPQDDRLIERVAAELALAKGDADGAWAASTESMSEPHYVDSPGHDLPIVFVAARALGERRRGGLDRPDRLDADAAWLRGLLDRLSSRWVPSVWPALVEAELASSGLDVGAWRSALDELSTVEGPAHLVAYAGYRLGLALTESGDRAGARQALREAASVADQLSAGLIRGWIAELSRRARIPLVEGLPSSQSTGTALTAREHEVLRLVAEGRSNREIGQELFISAKTASVHVSNILAKLGVSGRGEAAALAHRDGLLDGAAS